MRESILRNTERVLKRCLKGKASITTATVVTFMITGGVVFGEVKVIENHDDINVVNEVAIEERGSYEDLASGNHSKIINYGKITSIGENIGHDQNAIYLEYTDFENTNSINAKDGTAIEMGTGYQKDEVRATLKNSNGGKITSKLGIRTFNTNIINDAEIIAVNNSNDPTQSGGGIQAVWGDVINNGSISVTGDYSDGIELQEGTLYNSKYGNITTSGQDANGIDSFDSSIENHGNIETDGYAAKGIHSVRSNIINKGNIVTKGDHGYGIDLQKQSIGENHGDILTEGDNARGISVDDNSSVINYGNVVTSGSNSAGIVASKNSNVENSSMIKTNGDNSTGIIVFESSIIENNGTIETNGYMAYGISGCNNSTVINNSVIETSGENSQGIGGQDSHVINSKTGIIRTSGEHSSAMNLSGEFGNPDSGSSLINDGQIITEGNDASGINGSWYTTVKNNGRIVTTGDYGSAGIALDNYSSAENNGEIRITGENSEGVRLRENSELINGENGIITTEGDNSSGVVAWGGKDNEGIVHGNEVLNSGTINTIGGDSKGIQGSYVNIVNNGSIFTNGEDGNGIEIWEGSSVANNGAIITGGYGAVGIKGGDMTATNNGAITTVADEGEGVALHGNASFINKKTGTIKTNGENAQGVVAWGEEGRRNSVVNNGLIETEGNEAGGIEGAFTNVENNGDITTSGSDGTGIAIWEDGSVTNNGTIQTTGDYSRGINGFNNSYVENNGNIETKGKRSYGAKVKEKSKMVNNGNITTDGYRANGIRSEYYTVVTNDGSIKTNGDNAYGLESYYEGYLENNGEVITTGNSTQGRTAAGMIMSMGSDGKNTNKVTTTGIGSVGVKVLTSLYDWDEYDPETLEGTDYKVMHKTPSESNFINTGLVKTSGNRATGIVITTNEAEEEFYNTAKEEGWELDHPGLENGSKLENTGTIETEGNASYGIYAYTEEGLAQSEVYNYKSGMVKTTGNGSTGAYIENSIFNNEGTIETFGNKAYGIYSDHSSIDNSGVIRTHGQGSYGIYAVNKSTVNHTGKIYVDDPNAYGIVYDETSKVTVSEDAVIEVGGDGSNGIQIISSVKLVEAYSEPVIFRAAVPMPSARRASGIAGPFALRSEVTTYTTVVPVQERAQLSNQGSISATGVGANAIVLKDADLINKGSISSERGYAIVSTGGDNTVTLGEGSNVEGIIKGGSGSDTLFLDWNNTDDLNVVGYNRMVKTGGGKWNLENSSIELVSSNRLSNISSYSEAEALYKNIGGDIVIGDNSTVTIKVDQSGKSGQMIAEGVTVEGNVNLDIDSSKNNGARELNFEDMVVTKNGVTLEDSGNIAVVSGGWKVDYQVESDGTVDVELKKIRYEDRADPSMGRLAGALERAYDSANPHMRGVMNTLNDISDKEFNSALKQICTDDYSAAVSTAVNASMSFQNNIRGFMNGGTSQGAAVRSSREGVRDNYIYATLIGNSSSYDGDSSTTGFDSDSYGAVGAYEFGSGIGFSLGYLATDTDYEDGRGSKSEADTYHIGTFYKYDNDRGLRVNTDLALDYTTNDVERRIAFGDITETARSDFDSYIISVGTEVMYDFYLDNNFRVTPKAAFTYGRIEQESFTESGASSLNVSQDSESYNSIRTSAGLEVAKEFIASSGTYELSSYAQWNHEFGDIYDDQEITIQDLEGKFVVPGLNVSEDTYEVGVGAEYTTNSDTTYFITYSYEGESSYDNHTGKLGVKYSF